MTIQDHYTSLVRQAQESWLGIADSLSAKAPKTFEQSVTPLGFGAADAAIDQVFDFWEQTLEMQRDAVKRLAGDIVSFSDTVRAQAQSVGETVREQTESARQAFREPAETAPQAGREQAGESHEELTKAELQDELDRRDLPRTGSVAELRTRLVEDDRKS